LVTSIGGYMAASYPEISFGTAVEGGSVPDTAQIIYSTVQSFALRNFIRDSDLIILDEAHVDLAAYGVMRRWLILQTRPCVFLTATPTDEVRMAATETLLIPAVPRFNIGEQTVEIPTFAKYLLEVRARMVRMTASTRVLVFVQTVSQAHTLARAVSRPSCILSSGHTDIDPTATLYIATSVADAGLTIPDVSVVFSTDQGFTVTTVEVPAADGQGYVRKTQPAVYKLSEQTRIQRRGRTGRTSDGIFIWVPLGTTPDVPKPWSVLDVVNELGASAIFFKDQFPEGVQNAMGAGVRRNGPTRWWVDMFRFVPQPPAENSVDDQAYRDYVEAAVVQPNPNRDPSGQMYLAYLVPSEIPDPDALNFLVFLKVKGNDGTSHVNLVARVREWDTEIRFEESVGHQYGLPQIWETLQRSYPPELLDSMVTEFGHRYTVASLFYFMIADPDIVPVNMTVPAMRELYNQLRDREVAKHPMAYPDELPPLPVNQPVLTAFIQHAREVMKLDDWSLNKLVEDAGKPDLTALALHWNTHKDKALYNLPRHRWPPGVIDDAFY